MINLLLLNMYPTSLYQEREKVNEVELSIQDLVNPMVCTLLILIIFYMYTPHWMLKPMNGLDFLRVSPTHLHMLGAASY